MNTIKSMFLALTIALFSSCESEQIDTLKEDSLLEVSATEKRSGCPASRLNTIRNTPFQLIVTNGNRATRTYNIPRNQVIVAPRGNNTRFETELSDIFPRRFLSSGVNRIVFRPRTRTSLPVGARFISQPGTRQRDGSIMLFGAEDLEIERGMRFNRVTRVPERLRRADISVSYQFNINGCD